MKEIVATVTGRGQITLPADVRRLLGVQSGSKVVFQIAEDGRVEVHVPRYADAASVRGVAGSLKTPLTWGEIRDIVREERTAATQDKLT